MPVRVNVGVNGPGRGDGVGRGTKPRELAALIEAQQSTVEGRSAEIRIHLSHLSRWSEGVSAELSECPHGAPTAPVQDVQCAVIPELVPRGTQDGDHGLATQLGH